MKTITEFLVTTLKTALKTRQELVAAGKTAEELPAAMGEALKLEGDKLTVLLSTLEIVEKKTNDLKRVVVCTLAEGEVAPKGLEKKGDHYFAVEFFPPMPGQERPRGQGRDEGKGKDRDRGGKRGGRGGKGGRDGGGPGRENRDSRGPGRSDGERGPRGDGRSAGGRPPREGAPAGGPTSTLIVINPPRPASEASANPSEGSQDKKRHAGDKPRRERKPRPPREPEAPHVTPPPSASPAKLIQARTTPLPPPSVQAAASKGEASSSQSSEQASNESGS